MSASGTREGEQPKVNEKADSLIHLLVEDANAALATLKANDTQTNRRHAVRTIFAGIEGAHYYAKQYLLGLADTPNLFSVHEIACLKEESYLVADNGVVRAQPKFVPLPTSIKQLAVLVKRLDAAYQLDFTHSAWDALLKACKTRNRITHPRSAADLAVSDQEMADVARALPWVLAFVIEAGVASVDKAKALSGAPKPKSAVEDQTTRD